LRGDWLDSDQQPARAINMSMRPSRTLRWVKSTGLALFDKWV